MPLYEYHCPKCGRFELIQKFSDAPITTCPTCGRDVQKLLSAPAIQFKGSGWYVTDYARKPSGEGARSSGSKSDGASTTTDSSAGPASPASSSGSSTGSGTKTD